MARTLQFRRTDQVADGCIADLDVVRPSTELDVVRPCADFPAAFVFDLCTQNTALLREEKPLALARTGKSLVSGRVAITAITFYGACGGSARQDVPVAEDAGESSGSDKDREARAA